MITNGGCRTRGRFNVRPPGRRPRSRPLPRVTPRACAGGRAPRRSSPRRARRRPKHGPALTLHTCRPAHLGLLGAAAFFEPASSGCVTPQMARHAEADESRGAARRCTRTTGCRSARGSAAAGERREAHGVPGSWLLPCHGQRRRSAYASRAFLPIGRREFGRRGGVVSGRPCRQLVAEPCRGHGQGGGTVELRSLMPGASQQHELGVRVGPAQRVVQGLPLGDRDDVVPVAVRDQEGRRLGRDPGEQAEVRGMIGGLDHRTHAQQTRLERERQEARLDTAAGAGDEQVGLTEPMDDGLDVAGLLAVSADSAFEPAIARRQRQERAELRVSPTHPHTAEGRLRNLGAGQAGVLPHRSRSLAARVPQEDRHEDRLTPVGADRRATCAPGTTSIRPARSSSTGASTTRSPSTGLSTRSTRLTASSLSPTST
jgi:hypothetical protein